MRLQDLEQIAGGLSTDNPVRMEAKTVIVAEVDRLRWRLWNGKAKDAQISIERIREVMHAFQGEPAGRRSGVPSRKLWTALHALNGYLLGQSDWTVNYAARHRAGLRVGTAITEGTANFLVNRRMSKSQQMRWTRRGADLLLQVRCAVYNGTLGSGLGSGSKQPTIHIRSWLSLPAPNPETVPSNVMDGLVSDPRFPLDGAADRWDLPGWCDAGCRNCSHGLNQFPTRAGRRRTRAALIKATPVFELAIRVIAEEVGRADSVIGSCHRLIFVVQIRKRKPMRLREALHGLERVLGVGISVVGADRRETDTLCDERSRIGGEAIDHCLHVGTMIADEYDHRAILAGDVGERMSPPIRARKTKVGGRRILREGRRRCGHGGHLLGLGIYPTTYRQQLYPALDEGRGNGSECVSTLNLCGRI
jgi:hypothetical protein